jgi:hypothetical protein
MFHYGSENIIIMLKWNNCKAKIKLLLYLSTMSRGVSKDWRQSSMNINAVSSAITRVVLTRIGSNAIDE